MGSNIVKTIVLLMVLVVLSFVVGAQVSDNVKDSVGAFAVIAAIVGASLLIYMGPRVWQLMFILPPFLDLVPSSLFDHAITQCCFAPFAVSTIVLGYWIVLWSMGRAKMRWRGAAILDIPFLLFVALMVAAYIRHPVVLNVMDLDYDSIGGEEVVILVFVLAHYVAFSIIPISKQELEKCLALSFKFFLLSSAVTISLGLLKGGAKVGVARFYLLYPLGSTLLFYAYSKYPIAKMLASVRCWAIAGFGLISALLTGQRQNMAFLLSGIVFIAFIKREVIVLIVALCSAYVGIIFLSEMGELGRLPHMVQRSVASIPGVKVNDAQQMSTSSTMETRYNIWSYAMDPRTGVIKDYVWGDGFAFSKAYMLRQSVAAMRGTGGGTNDNEGMTVSRNFHNGAIHTISRIGYIGFAHCLFMCVLAWGVSIQVLRAWYRTETYPYIVLGVINMPITLQVYPYASITTKYFLFSLQSYIFLKLCYCIARESGTLRPLFRQPYVPLMIQEQEQPANAA